MDYPKWSQETCLWWVILCNFQDLPPSNSANLWACVVYVVWLFQTCGMPLDDPGIKRLELEACPNPSYPSCTSTKTLQVAKQHRHLSTDAGYAGLPSCTRQRWQPAIVCYDSRIYASLGVFQEVNRKSSTTSRPLDVLTIRVACCIFHTTWEVCTSITMAI